MVFDLVVAVLVTAFAALSFVPVSADVGLRFVGVAQLGEEAVAAVKSTLFQWPMF